MSGGHRSSSTSSRHVHAPPGLSMTKMNPNQDMSRKPTPKQLQIPSFLDQDIFTSPMEQTPMTQSHEPRGDPGSYPTGVNNGQTEPQIGLSHNSFPDPSHGGQPGDNTVHNPEPPSPTEGSVESMGTNEAASYPGVVMSAGSGLGFDDVKLDDATAEFLDPAAASATTHHGHTKPAGANIAPWLQEDEPPSPSTKRFAEADRSDGPSPTESTVTAPTSANASTTNLDHRKSHLAHFPSVPHLPRFLHRQHHRDSETSSFVQPPYASGSEAPSLRSSSASSLLTEGAQTPKSYRPQSVSEARARSPPPSPPSRHGSVASTGGHFHAPPHRFTRFGSQAMGSNVSLAQSQSEKKKGGFLGNLLKRRTGQSVAGTAGYPPHPDFGPPLRSQTAGPSRMSVSTTASSLRQQSISSTKSAPAGPHSANRQFSYKSDADGSYSPLHEGSEDEREGHEFELNTDLDDMEGIVDPQMANAAPRPSATMSISPVPHSEMGLADALHHTSSFVSDSSGGAVEGGLPRHVLEANTGKGSFTRPNPFSSPTSSTGGDLPPSMGTPPSPFDVSPKHSMIPGASNQPRRPSQLRNVKMGSIDSANSDVSAVQPIGPSWAQHMTPAAGMFKDPFSSNTGAGFTERVPVSPSRQATTSISGVSEGSSGQTGGPSQHGSIAPAIPSHTSQGAAWAAPESWGVEGDEEEIGEDDSSSNSGTEEWHDGDQVDTPTGINGGESPSESALPSGAQTPFNKSRAPRNSVWPLKRKAEYKVSGPDFNPTVPHFTRIYRADGTYDIMSFLLNTTVADILNNLAGNDGKKAHSMKLYVRERGQDRQMLPSERPIALQARRLFQSGFTEAEHIEEIGKDDWSMLCKFIYQTPVLPVMNPDEESLYESFEFIDLSGRDLQVIPIFLHLHADNIIILNVSRNPMTDIPLDFVQACKSLKELRMSNMALKRVPQSIRESASLSRLDLSCNRISDLESAQLNYIETLLSLKVQNNRLSSIPSYFIQMKALKYLNISNNVFEDFPSVVCEMSNLVDLDVSFNRIAQLPAEMSNLKSLERLICVGNELKEFPKSFSTLANLRVLDVRRNKLVDLTPVYALPNLATLRADSNDLVTLDTQLGAKVRDFSVPWNSITRFTLAPKPGMTAAYALTHLNLSHGKLSTLEDSALSELVNLVDLNLSFNQFTRLPQTLDKLINLEIFECTDNMLASLPAGCFGNMQKLRICNIHNNNLKDVPSDIWLCSSLETINMSSNLLEGELPDPPAEWLEKLKALEANGRKFSTVSAATTATMDSEKAPIPPAGTSLLHLFLGDNRLTEEVFRQIQLFSNLKVLNVSFNNILEVPPYTISRCHKLEALYLSGNKLTSLPAEDLEKLTHLRVLHLNGNKLQTLPSELGSIKNLEHLDVGSNVLKYNIANWPYDWNWNWNTALRYLNLSGNKRLEIKPTSGQELSHAASGVRRDLSDFNALSHLRVLGLMDVTLRIPSLPDESDEKRVRTSFSDINNMAYGISDMLGPVDHLAMFDLVVPHFRGSLEECVFGMFGRSCPTMPSGKIPKYVQDHFSLTLADQLARLQPEEAVDEALRRTFLWVNKSAFDNLAGIEKRHRDSTGDFLGMPQRRNTSLHSQLRTGASGAVVYLKGKTLHVANAGDTLVVISRKGEAELLGKKHDPTDREETARIRRAEAWVSPKGLVNDDKEIDVSRAFGFYHALPAVNASPDVRTRQLSESDEFLIIGNSALWKCTPYQTAVDIARTEREDPMMAAQKLRDFAISYGAEGSVMVMVVNVSDLFFGGSGLRGRALTGGTDIDGSYLQRRRREEVGDRTLNRLQQEIEPPTGQVAIVFTDIVNSTALWETNPGMPTAIKMHHSLMRRQLRLDGGYEVKTEGDSFMVSFQSVTAALLWAFNCQIGLLQLEWPRELLESEDGKVIYDSKGNIIHRGLRVRMGVHWGAPECEKDPITRRMDYYGPMVNRAARINASADGGQLMTSQDVVNVIRELREYIESSDDHALDELPAEVKREVLELRRIGGLELKDVGEKKLKGLEVPEKLSLLLPKTLSGRLELFTGLRANVEVNEARAFASEKQLEETRQLSALTLRLEALCTVHPAEGTGVSSPTSLTRPQQKPAPAHYLGPGIRENMTEDELIDVVASLTTRIENVLSTLYIKHLGGLAVVLKALGVTPPQHPPQPEHGQEVNGS